MIGFIVTSVWDPAYQGPMTGIGPALLMIAGIGAIGVGTTVALVAFGVGAINRTRRRDGH